MIRTTKRKINEEDEDNKEVTQCGSLVKERTLKVVPREMSQVLNDY